MKIITNGKLWIEWGLNDVGDDKCLLDVCCEKKFFFFF